MKLGPMHNVGLHEFDSASAVNVAGFQCLEVPTLQGLQKWRANMVDRIKRSALHQLHCSRGGEMLLLRMYLVGEEATECALLEDWTQEAPQWIQQQVAQHLTDERHHARAFAQELRLRGSVVSEAAGTAQPDRISLGKIMKWRKLSLDYAPRFTQGLLVPAYATGLCAEQMAMRVLKRHCDLIGDQHAMHPLLARVLSDEIRHVQQCQDMLKKLVEPTEIPALERLLFSIRAIDASFGITGALGMYAAGIFYRVFSFSVGSAKRS